MNGDVLERNPLWIGCLQKAKNLTHEARVVPGNTPRAAGLAQVLTGKSCTDQLRCRQTIELSDVADNGHPWEAGVQDCLSCRIDFAEQLGGVASIVQSELDPPYAGKKPHYSEGTPVRHAGQSTSGVGRDPMPVSSEETTPRPIREWWHVA